jgi:hypothetical protein
MKDTFREPNVPSNEKAEKGVRLRGSQQVVLDVVARKGRRRRRNAYTMQVRHEINTRVVRPKKMILHLLVARCGWTLTRFGVY